MQFILKNFSMTNGGHYKTIIQKSTDPDVKDIETPARKLVITGHVTSKIKDFPYDGKFEQVDYDQDIEIPEDVLPPDIEARVPEIVQGWIDAKYPPTI